MNKTIRFIDLFAGIGGIRKGFELACREQGFSPVCVFTSEIKPYAIDVLKQNHPDEEIAGDITKVDETTLPDFEFLLAGFPCQAFSAAGKRLGFQDTRGTLFFDVERILKEKKPFGFVLENVEGLVNHDREKPQDKMGRTLSTILSHLHDLGYEVNWQVLNAKDFGVAQERKRIYIVGTRTEKPNLQGFSRSACTLATVLEHGLPTVESRFTKRLLRYYTVEELCGKAIKDKRGGGNNIHSWDIELKGPLSAEQKVLLNRMMTERRKKKWAQQYGIDWMDGMPLTIDMIRTFYDHPQLEAMLEDLVKKAYVRKEHPKRKDGNRRKPDETLPLGYNIVAGKMSFEVSKVLSPSKLTPTLVAMDMQHLFVPDGTGIRPLTLREGLRLFGYPDDYRFHVSTEEGYDLLGNTVVVPVIQAVSNRVLTLYEKSERANVRFPASESEEKRRPFMKLTAAQIYNQLVNVERIQTVAGQIRFQLGGVDIVVKKKDVVGNILQEWLEGWLTARGVDYDPNPNTQMPPDVYLDPADHTHNLLEVKAFNRNSSPAFDIADFKAFVNELIEKPYHLDTDYLIFGYSMDEKTGNVLIQDVWLKKIWEITKTMSDWPITVQYKNGLLQKMRPGNWYTTKGKGRVFASKEDYLSAFEQTVFQNPETRAQSAQWKRRFQESYRKHYGEEIEFPRWDDIKHNYGR